MARAKKARQDMPQAAQRASKTAADKAAGAARNAERKAQVRASRLAKARAGSASDWDAVSQRCTELVAKCYRFYAKKRIGTQAMGELREIGLILQVLAEANLARTREE